MTSRTPVEPDRWVIVYQEPGSGGLKMLDGLASDRAAELMVKALQGRGCVVHAARTQRDLMRALGARG